MKNLFYVNGGGLGHLSRISAFIFTQKIELSESLILSSSEFSSLLFPISSIKSIPDSYSNHIQKLAKFIQNTLNQYSFENIYIDTFPLGILGELQFVDFKNITINYIARHLKWSLYSSINQKNKIKYHFTYITESIDNEQLEFISSNSKKHFSLKLDYKIDKPKNKVLESLKSKNETWIIVHSTPESEVLALLEHAKDIAKAESKKTKLIVISQCKLDISEDIFQLDYFPAYALFPYVDRIISACGFNIMQQTRNFRKKQITIPFPRKYDDQFRRKKLLFRLLK